MTDQEYLKNLPRKRMASGVIFFNEAGEILIVKPSYKDHWSVPGGVIDKDESPRDAALREVKEEVGLDLKSCVFFVSIIYRRKKVNIPRKTKISSLFSLAAYSQMMI